MTYCKKRLLGHFTQKLNRCWVDLGTFLVDLGSTWGRFGVDFRSWEGLGRSWGSLGEVLGALGGFWGGLREALGAQDRFLIDFGLILKPVLGSPTDPN